MRVDKLWGHEDILTNGSYCMKILTMQTGFQSSLHYHKEKHETFLVVEGVCDMEVGFSIHRFTRGEYQVIPPGVQHRFRAINERCVVVECSTHHDDADVIRLEESRRIE